MFPYLLFTTHTQSSERTLNNADQIIYEGTTYTNNGFMKMLLELGQSMEAGLKKTIAKRRERVRGKIEDKKEKTKGKGQANSVAVSVEGRTITVGDNRYKCDTKAEEVALSMPRNKDQYYPAMLYNDMVWVAPVAIPRKVALSIMMLNSSKAGVFSVSENYARGLCNGLGGSMPHPSHGAGSGYWKHYHGKNYQHAHCWYIG